MNDPIYDDFNPSPEHSAVGTLLVGAEGIGEIRAVDWARQPTTGEVEEFMSRWSQYAEERGKLFKYNDYTIDGNGRPYWIVTVLDNAPIAAQRKAKQYARVLRLID